eukprot:Phypoly_transcript_12032.p1 GENE.Phypoly_transcript_12032~~Phypoly_transcript_12032.p1  ORF type:complete len:356 (+),score=49.38 Phypoly_transcript_12032:59-1126(+)
MVNSVIGDESFAHYYHISPLLFSLFGSNLFEDFRIKTHLLFIHQLLQNKDCAFLSCEQNLKRKEGLRNLEQYARDRVFPRNYDHWKRIPSFVDTEGRLCAVAHIMHRAGDGDLVKEIDNLFHNNYLYDMKNHKALNKWVGNSGFTLSELAMIQPGYPPFHYCFSTFFYAFMCLFIGISALVQYEKMPSSPPPHYRSVLLGLIINNFVGILFSAVIMLAACCSQKANRTLGLVLFRLFWCIANFGLLSFYIANVAHENNAPSRTKTLFIAGLVLTSLCFVISALCDLSGVFVHIQLEPQTKRRKMERKKREQERMEGEKEGGEEEVKREGERSTKEGVGEEEKEGERGVVIKVDEA